MAATYTGQDLIDQFRETYNDLSDARILELINEVDTEILAAVPLRRSSDYLPMVSGQAQYTLDETIVEVGEAIFEYNEARRSRPLDFVSVDFMKAEYPGYRFHSNGTPTKIMLSNNASQGLIELYRTPDFTSLLVTDATNTTPVVVESAEHGLSTGDQVTIREVGGNTAANGYFTITKVDDDNFSLDDSVGNGAYTSGGVIGTASAPILRVDVVQRTVIGAGTDLPITPQVYSMYVNGACYKWACRKHKDDIGLYKGLFEDDIAASSKISRERADNMPISILGFKQRKNFVVPGSRMRHRPEDIID